MRCSIYSAVFAAIFVASTLAQGPGNGVAKGTYASSNPVVGLEWIITEVLSIAEVTPKPPALFAFQALVAVRNRYPTLSWTHEPR